MLISNFGLGKYPHELMMAKAIQVIADLKKVKIIHCSAYGTNETRADLPFLFGKVMLPLLIAPAYRDHEAIENLLKKSQANWVVARPGFLTDTDRTGTYQAVTRFSGSGMAKISRKDLAHFMVKCIQDSSFDRQTPGLRY